MQVLSIISAITSGILTLISVVDIFGMNRDNHCGYYAPHYSNTVPTNPTNLTLHHPTHYDNNPCCSDNWQDIEGCYTTTINDWGIHTLIHLPLSLAMLACSIISTSLTCVAREESRRGVVWTTQQGN